ncbi:hypothetical protein WOLCODRAFT_163105 [Wolfiporia cocos MD-104 SS10]|uniref:Aminoglycoside phosphotransferase domain-containing protein n=1 Tax=Wolfiporia cocos (strain MD-104) TaxID=742152 RepID=A0A2H3JH04_WOLCO|nr:hypothetical protein WOLCODRAFT_163105 [Wolfiporia cocos MD-104 SS10]
MSIKSLSLDPRALQQDAMLAAKRYRELRRLPYRRDLPEPFVTSMTDMAWGGEVIIEILFRPSSVPDGPLSLYALVLDRIVLAEAYVGMSWTAANAGISVPPIIWHKDNVIFLEPIPGQSLDNLWPKLTNPVREAICKKLAFELLKMFNYRSSNGIYTARAMEPNGVRGIQDPDLRKTMLVSRPFNDGPLSMRKPPATFVSNEEYLVGLVRRIELVFDDYTIRAPTSDQKRCWPGKETLSVRDMTLIRDTWRRLRELIRYHEGAWYVAPSHWPSADRSLLGRILRSGDTAICHPDLQMSRIIVHPKAGPEYEVTLTGWQHAYFAPLWSSARLPPWMVSSLVLLPAATGPQPNLQDEAWMQTFMTRHMAMASLEWRIAYQMGEMERVFEECIGAHWKYRDRIEVCLVWLKQMWKQARPQSNFPIPVVEGDNWERIITDPTDPLYAVNF